MLGDRLLLFVTCFGAALLACSSTFNACASRPENLPATDRSLPSISLLGKSAASLGGQVLWRNVRGILVSGNVQSQTERETHPFSWEDHWAGRYKMARDRNISGKQTRFLQDPDVAMKLPSKRGDTSTSGPSPQSFDPVAGLMIHAPAVAIARVLDQPSYSVQSVKAPRAQAGDDCVLIMKTPDSSKEVPLQVMLCMSPKTHLPSFATVRVASLINFNQAIFERIQYVDFQTQSGMTSPKTVIVTKPSGMRETYTLDAPRFNASVREHVFAKGEQ